MVNHHQRTIFGSNLVSIYDRLQFSLHIQLYHSCNKYGFNFSNNFQLPEETKAAELEASNNGL